VIPRFTNVYRQPKSKTSCKKAVSLGETSN
jgi:hypothetical protein